MAATQTSAAGRNLTAAKLAWLQRASKLSPGEFLRWGGKSNSGGSIRRMMNGLVREGLMIGPPYQITEAGRAALAATKTTGAA